jgi:uncharacterized protein
MLRTRCPICRKFNTQQQPWFPFCSQQCREIDLSRWANEEYRIPGAPAPDEMPPGDDEDSRS